MNNYILFSLQFALTNIIFSVIIFGVLSKINKEGKHSNKELLLYSFGLGPIFTVLLLYYLFLFVPGRSDLFYFLSICIIYALLSLTELKFLSFSILIEFLKSAKNKFKNIIFSIPKKSFLPYAGIFLVLIPFLVLFIINSLCTPVRGHDSLGYASFGNILYMEKSMDWVWKRTYPQNNYYYKIDKAPSYSLFATWEKIMDDFLGIKKDLYYRSVSFYYALLVLLVFLFWLMPINKYLSFLGVFIFITSFSFWHPLTAHHLDFFRIFFLGVSWIFLMHAVKKRDFLSFTLLGVFSGLAAFIHNIGAALVLVNIFVLFVFLKGSFKYKFKKAGYVLCLTIIFGWFHYILDIFWGWGWLIFKRNVTFWG